MINVGDTIFSISEFDKTISINGEYEVLATKNNFVKLQGDVGKSKWYPLSLFLDVLGEGVEFPVSVTPPRTPSFKFLTEEAYDALSESDSETMYFIKNNTNSSIATLFGKDKHIENIFSIKNWKNKLTSLYLNKDRKLTVCIYGDSITTGAFASDRVEQGYVGIMRNYFENIFQDVGKGVQSTRRNHGIYWNLTGTWAEDIRFGLIGCHKSSTLNDTAEWDFNGKGCRFYYVTGAAAGKIYYSIDDGEELMVDAYNSEGVLANSYIDIDGLEEGDHTLKLRVGTAGKFIYCTGAYAHKNEYGVNVHNISLSGKTIGDMDNSSFPGIMLDMEITQLQPDLGIICFLANDPVQNTSLSNYRAKLEKIIDYLRSQGSDVAMVATGIRSDVTPEEHEPYIQIYEDVAKEKGVLLMNLYRELGSWERADRLGYMHDYAHYTNRGHEYVGNKLAKIINI